MYKEGYKNIVNIDISEVVIEDMANRNKEYKEMTWLSMDALNMEKFENEKFDIVIDKSTMDAILCGDFSFYNTAKMLSEIQRVLKTGGIYMVISYGQPETRTFHFTREHLDFKVESFTIS
jgi:ubiquinone/menaquinone biosynthesis C-methylase UbiE